MAKFKCSDGIYTVLRNGKVVASGATAGEAIVAISADAGELACCDIVVTGMQENGGNYTFDVTVDGTNMNLAYDYNNSAVTGLVGCETKASTIIGLDFDDYIVNTDPLELTFYSSVDACRSYCAEYVVSKYSSIITIPTIGDPTVEAVPVGSPACTGVTLYEEIFTTLVGATLNTATGAVTIPAQVIVGTAYYVYAKYCDGLLTAILVIEVTSEEPPQGLRLTYTPGNLPANNLAAWNAFFDLPANGTAFTSLSTAGDEVTLFGGAGITLKASLFRTSATLLKIEDDIDCVVAIAGGKNLGALSLCPALTTVTLNGVIVVAQEGLYTNAALTSLSMNTLTTAGVDSFALISANIVFNLPALTTVGDGCFANCTLATTFTLSALTTIGSNCFANNTAATTFDLSNCTNLGGTVGNNSVFLNIIGNNVTVTIPIAQQTIDGGSPDGDLVYLAANNTATINYI